MNLDNPIPKKLSIGAQKVSSLKLEEQREIRKKQSEIERSQPRKLERVSMAEQAAEEQSLRFGEITKIEELKNDESTSKVFIIELEGGDKAILKIVNLDDEKYTSHKIELHAAQTERAAYLLSKILGFNFVPTTVIRERLDYEDANQELKQIEDELGEDDRFVVQKFAKGKTAAQLGSDLVGVPVELMADITVFDYIIANVDRNNSNYLCSESRIVAIDNEMSFGDDGFGFELVISDLESAVTSSTKISGALQSIIHDFNMNRESRKKEIYLELENLMPKEHIHATISRLEQITDLILKHGYIPADKVADLTFK